MTSKLFIGGKLVASNEQRYVEPGLIRGRKRVPVEQGSSEIEQPYEKRFLTKAIGEIHHSPDGIPYRVFKYLDPRAGWCTAEQLMEEFGVPYQAVADWAIVGHIEPGMEQGSPSRRFRVRDVGKLRLVAAKWLTEAARKQAIVDAHLPPTPKMIRGRLWR